MTTNYILVSIHVDDYHHNETHTSSSVDQIMDIIANITTRWQRVGCDVRVIHVDGTNTWRLIIDN